jgi:hypothetical protein
LTDRDEEDVVRVTKIASMLERTTENTPRPPRPGWIGGAFLVPAAAALTGRGVHVSSP